MYRQPTSEPHRVVKTGQTGHGRPCRDANESDSGTGSDALVWVGGWEGVQARRRAKRKVEEDARGFTGSVCVRVCGRDMDTSNPVRNRRNTRTWHGHVEPRYAIEVPSLSVSPV